MIKENFYILDTSALIAYLANERGADDISSILNNCAIPFICLTELYYLVWNRLDKAKADSIYGIVKSWDLPVLLPNERVILNAGRLKAIYKLGIADSYIASFAIEHNCKLVTKDLDYNVLKNEIDIFKPE
ncbi:MAG: PIN domain-containing protein [Armatimonadota bacterium]